MPHIDRRHLAQRVARALVPLQQYRNRPERFLRDHADDDGLRRALAEGTPAAIAAAVARHPGRGGGRARISCGRCCGHDRRDPDRGCRHAEPTAMPWTPPAPWPRRRRSPRSGPWRQKADQLVEASLSANTRIAYGKAWRAWSDWCLGFGLDPTGADPAAAADARWLVDAPHRPLGKALAEHHPAAPGRGGGDPQAAEAAARSSTTPSSTPSSRAAPDQGRPAGAQGGAARAEPARRLPGADPRGASGPGRRRAGRRGGEGRRATSRDMALLLIGFAGGFRRSELAAFDLRDVSFSAEGLVLFVGRSKADQERHGAEVGIEAVPRLGPLRRHGAAPLARGPRRMAGPCSAGSTAAATWWPAPTAACCRSTRRRSPALVKRARDPHRRRSGGVFGAQPARRDDDRRGPARHPAREGDGAWALEELRLGPDLPAAREPVDGQRAILQEAAGRPDKATMATSPLENRIAVFCRYYPGWSCLCPLRLAFHQGQASRRGPPSPEFWWNASGKADSVWTLEHDVAAQRHLYKARWRLVTSRGNFSSSWRSMVARAHDSLGLAEGSGVGGGV